MVRRHLEGFPADRGACRDSGGEEGPCVVVTLRESWGWLCVERACFKHPGSGSGTFLCPGSPGKVLQRRVCSSEPWLGPGTWGSAPPLTMLSERHRQLGRGLGRKTKIERRRKTTH